MHMCCLSVGERRRRANSALCAGLPEGLVQRASAFSAKLEAGQKLGAGGVGALLSRVHSYLAGGLERRADLKRLQGDARALVA